MQNFRRKSKDGNSLSIAMISFSKKTRYFCYPDLVQREMISAKQKDLRRENIPIDAACPIIM